MAIDPTQSSEGSMVGHETNGAKRYSSFIVRGARRGGETLEIAHEQSGERIRATSLSEAIGWMQKRSGTAEGEVAPRPDTPAGVAPAGNASEPLRIVKQGERRERATACGEGWPAFVAA